MTKRSADYPAGVLHRRVFGTLDRATNLELPNSLYWGPTLPNYVEGSSPKLELGIGALPRKQGYVWGAEILKIAYNIENPKEYTGADWPDFNLTFGVFSSNASPITTFCNANPGQANMWRVDQCLDTCTYEYRAGGMTGAAVYVVGQQWGTDIGHEEHYLTDTMGTGVVVFSDCLYMAHMTTIAPPNAIFSDNPAIQPRCACEVWYRYVTVPLEVFLSTQEDHAKSGV